MRPARAGARCFGGAQRPVNEDVLTDEVGFCLFGSHHEPRLVRGLGSAIPNLQNKVEAYG